MKIQFLASFGPFTVLQGTSIRSGHSACLHPRNYPATPFTDLKRVLKGKERPVQARHVWMSLEVTFHQNGLHSSFRRSSRQFNGLSVILHFPLTFLAGHRKFNHLEMWRKQIHVTEIIWNTSPLSCLPDETLFLAHSPSIEKHRLSVN